MKEGTSGEISTVSKDILSASCSEAASAGSFISRHLPVENWPSTSMLPPPWEASRKEASASACSECSLGDCFQPTQAQKTSLSPRESPEEEMRKSQMLHKQPPGVNMMAVQSHLPQDGYCHLCVTVHLKQKHKIGNNFFLMHLLCTSSLRVTAAQHRD